MSIIVIDFNDRWFNSWTVEAQSLSCFYFTDSSLFCYAMNILKNDTLMHAIFLFISVVSSFRYCVFWVDAKAKVKRKRSELRSSVYETDNTIEN